MSKFLATGCSKMAAASNGNSILQLPAEYGGCSQCILTSPLKEGYTCNNRNNKNNTEDVVLYAESAMATYYWRVKLKIPASHSPKRMGV